MRIVLSAILLTLLYGCDATGGGHVQGQANCQVNPATGEVTCGGGVVIKNATREIRGVDPCGNSRVISRVIDVRVINRSAREQKIDLEAQIRDLNRVARATSSTGGMTIRRFFTPRGCDCGGVMPVPATVPDVFAPIPETPVALPNVNPAPVPSDFGSDIPPSGVIPPPADRAVTNALVKRVENLESRVNGIDGKLDAILLAVSHK